jgi:eukaryotic-like serine/threonine-protein kinase
MRLAPPRVEPLIVGRYALHGEIASGGMATVYVGRLLGSDGFSRTVAVKRLHPQFVKDSEFSAMLLDEALLSARIRHPNVISTLDVVRRGDELCIVMEYVAGEPLSRLARLASSRGERIPIPIAASILTGMLHGLHAAHEARSEAGEPLEIVHRDVSPQNVIVGVDGVARVLDFGVAKASIRMQESTASGQVKGKIAYMAPEQLSGDHVDRRADLWAAGVVAWEILTGERLFSGEAGRVVLRIATGGVDAPSSRTAGVPSALDAVVLRALAKDRAGRFSSAREMALAIERAATPASSTDVAEWVEAFARDSLSERAQVVRAAELADREGSSISSPRATPAVDPASARDPAPAASLSAAEPITVLTSASSRERSSTRGPRSRLAIAGLGLAVVGAVAGIGLVARGRSVQAGVDGEAPRAAVPSPQPAVPAASTAPEVAPREEPTAGREEATAPRASAAPAPRPKPSGRSAPAAGRAPRSACAEPFSYVTVEGKTIKKWKPECLQ